jgi:hypothetical protein
LPESSENEVDVSSSSEYDINVEKDLNSFQTEQPHIVYSLKQTMKVIRRVATSHKKVVTSIHEELHNLYSSPSIIRPIKSRRMRWAGHMARIGEKRNAHRILVGKLEGKRPLGRPRCRWVDNIKMHLREIGWDVVDWIDMAQDKDQWRALVNTVLNLRAP